PTREAEVAGEQRVVHVAAVQDHLGDRTGRTPDDLRVGSATVRVRVGAAGAGVVGVVRVELHRRDVRAAGAARVVADPHVVELARTTRVYDGGVAQAGRAREGYARDPEREGGRGHHQRQAPTGARKCATAFH